MPESIVLQLPSIPDKVTRGVRRQNNLALQYCFLLAVFAFASFSYYFLIIQDSYDVFSSDGRFSRIIIPDTFIYKSYGESQNTIITTLDIKNYIGPAFLAYVMKDIPYGDIIINILFIGIVGIYFIKILKLLNINSTLPLLILFLNPESIYYSQGFLKEIPSLLFVTMFAYYFLKKKYVYLVPIILAAGIFRYQIGLILILILCMEIFPKYKFKILHLFLFLLFALLPVVYIYLVPAELYYLYSAGSEIPPLGIGSIIFSSLQNIPLFGYVGIPIRILQNLFEPFPRVPLFYGGEGIINLYFVTMLISLFIMVFFYIIFFKSSFFFILGKYRNKMSEPLYRLLFIILIFAILASINSFVHHRYMYPIVPLMSFMYFIESNKKNIYIMSALFLCIVYLLIINVAAINNFT